MVKKFTPKKIPNHLGRWRIEKCDKKMDQKIDLSNEDHCGPCGEYNLKKIELTNNNNIIAPLEKDYLPHLKGVKNL
jgi:hypothetical protein